MAIQYTVNRKFNFQGVMKIVIRSFALALFVGVGCAVAQIFRTLGDPVNFVGEAQVRTVASQLVVGMRQEDVIALLASNRLKMYYATATNQLQGCVYYTNAQTFFRDTNGQSYVPRLRLFFRPIAEKSGIMSSNTYLESALLRDEQIARTNAP